MFYFTSDTHFGDDEILKQDLRPFKNAKQFAKTLIKTLIKYYKDEIRSYTVGYEAHSKYLGQELPQAKSIIEMYEKLVMALKQERVNIVKNKIKDFIGLG